MRGLACAAVVVVALVVVTGVARGDPLTGQDLHALPVYGGADPYGMTATVGDSYEFSLRTNVELWRVDFDENGEFTIARPRSGNLFQEPSYRVTFTDIDETIPEIVGLSVTDIYLVALEDGTPGIRGFGYQADSFWVELGSRTSWGPYSYITMQLEFATPVPEPGTLALFGLGVVGLAWRVRRRRVK